MSCALEDCAFARDVQLDFIRPGGRVEYAFIEAFNGRLHEGCLNVHQFTSIEDAQPIEAWRVNNYNVRQLQRAPITQLSRALTPNEFVALRQAERTANEAGSSS